MDTFALSVVAAPTATSTADDISNLDVRSPIVLTFSENVTATAGNIIIRDLNGTDTGFRLEATDNTQTIAANDTSQVTISGSTVTIDPTFDLDFGTNYRLELATGVFTGNTSGQGSVAIGGTDIAFTTVTPTNSGAASQVQTAGTDAVGASFTYVSGHQSDPNNATVEVNAGGGATALVLSFSATNRVADGNISFRNVTADDLLYLDRTVLNTTGDTAINGGGAWSVLADSEGNNSARKSFSGDGLGAQVIYNGQTSIFADSFLTTALGAETIIIG